MNKIIFPVFVFLFLIQFSFSPLFFSSGISFNLLLALIVVLIKKFDFRQVFIWVLLAGVIYDYFSVQTLGIGIITFLLIGFLIDFIQKKISINERSIFFNIIFYVLVKIVFDVVMIVVEKIFIVLGMADSSDAFSEMVFLDYLWGMIGFVVVCLVLSKFFNKIKSLNSTNLKLD